MSLPRVCLVGPLPPPSGGMGNQCAQLLRLLRADGLQVELVQTNPPYWPAWVARIPVLRAVLRLPPYLHRLWRATTRADVVHVLANSGWAWHLFAAPAIGLARLRHVAVIVHYHGGNAEAFLAGAPPLAHRLLAGAALRVLPSPFLQRVFARQGLATEVIPNSVDLMRFRPRAGQGAAPAPQLLVSRNLEPVYDIGTAIRAFARIRRGCPAARLTVAGSGPERAALETLTRRLQVLDAVDFVGRIRNDDMPGLLARASCLINPSLVDNQPVSIIEAFACGVPVVSTCAGGIPDMLQHGRNGLLVEPGDDAAMAAQVLRILRDPALARRLGRAGLVEAEKYSWSRIRPLWLGAYRRAAGWRGP